MRSHLQGRCLVGSVSYSGLNENRLLLPFAGPPLSSLSFCACDFAFAIAVFALQSRDFDARNFFTGSGSALSWHDLKLRSQSTSPTHQPRKSMKHRLFSTVRALHHENPLVCDSGTCGRSGDLIMWIGTAAKRHGATAADAARLA